MIELLQDARLALGWLSVLGAFVAAGVLILLMRRQFVAAMARPSPKAD